MLLFNTIVLTLLALLVIPAMIAVCLKSPSVVALPMVAVLILFSSSSWGQMEVENTIYSRGVGVLNFSLLNIALFVAGFGVLLRRLATPYAPALAPPMSAYFLGFAALLLGHLLVGTISGVEFFRIVGYTGIINVLNMLIFMFLVIAAFRSEKDQRKLMTAIIVLAGLRAIFGLVRYQWFGGDSANPYRNLEGLDIKLVFFDIADNFIASLAAFWAAWKLTVTRKKLPPIKRLGVYLFLLLEIATVALSFRRSSLVGLALMFLFLLFRMPSRRRMQFIMLAGVLLVAAAVIFFQQRLQYSSNGNFITALIYDIAPDKNILNESRLYEWVAAAQSVGGNWLTGLGTWGTFTGDQEVLAYHQGKFDFIHSGFGHIMMKTGLIGLLLFTGLLIKFCSYYFRHSKYLIGNARLLADTGFAGLLFWMPTLLIGTPIIEFRSMLLLGLSLALPFIAVGITRQRTYQQQALAPQLQPYHYAAS